jgi:hypothetical protein
MTKLYLRDTAAPSGMPSDEQSSVLPNGTLRTGPNWSTQRGMSTTAGAAQTADTFTHDADGVHYDCKFRIFGWALPTTQAITAQSWTIALAGVLSNANANSCFEVSLYVYRSGTGVVGSIIDAHQGVNFSALYTILPTAEGGRVEAIAGSGVSGVASGDVLVLEVWHHILQGMASAYTSTFDFNGTTDPVHNTAVSSAASYIETPQNLETGGGAAPVFPLFTSGGRDWITSIYPGG